MGKPGLLAGVEGWVKVKGGGRITGVDGLWDPWEIWGGWQQPCSLAKQGINLENRMR